MGKRRPKTAPEEQLVANVVGWSHSYFIAQHAYDAPIEDEAITTLTYQIRELDSRHQQHVGQRLEISLVCARRYSKEGVEPAGPSLLYVTLRKNQRSLLSYLPADTYWALPTLLSSEDDPCVEISFERLHRGTGALRSLWLGSYEQLLQDRAELAQRTRAT